MKRALRAQSSSTHESRTGCHRNWLKIYGPLWVNGKTQIVVIAGIDTTAGTVKVYDPWPGVPVEWRSLKNGMLPALLPHPRHRVRRKRDIEIIGVIDNIIYSGPRESQQHQVFVAEPQESRLNAETFYVRTHLDSKLVFGEINDALKRLDSRVPAYEMRTLESQLDQTLLIERLIATMSTAFGALETLLASIGLYGVMAFVVARWTKEIGVRMALGAMRESVVRLVMREVLALLGLGLAVEIPAALALGRFISGQLYGVQANDPWIAGIAVSLLFLTAAMAGLVPGRRASRIDPLRALRYE